MAYEHFTPGPLDRSFYDPDSIAKNIIMEKDETIKRLKGKDAERDAEICKKIREWMMNCTASEDMKNLSYALVNMNTILREGD